MKYIIFLMFPLLSFAQLTKQDSLLLVNSMAQAKQLTVKAYNKATEVSNQLLQKAPKDSILMVNRARLYNMYVNKSKCSKYITPKQEDLCGEALAFYTKVATEFNYPRIAIAQGMVYYNLYDYTSHNPGQQTIENKTKAENYFNKAIGSKELADFEVLKIKTLINRLISE